MLRSYFLVHYTIQAIQFLLQLFGFFGLKTFKKNIKKWEELFFFVLPKVKGVFFKKGSITSF